MASNPYPDLRRGVWRMKYRPDPTGPWVGVNLGKDPRITKTSAPAHPPQSVADRAREFADLEYRAKHGISEAPARAKGLAGYADAYLESFTVANKPGSVKQARRHVTSFVAFLTGREITTVQAARREHCRAYLDLRIKIVSHDTLRTEVGYIKPLWQRAVDDGLMLRNPWARLKIPGKSTASDPVYWSETEVIRIAANCAKAWQTDLVLMLANTGMRISTTLAMQWSWIDWSVSVIRIPKSEAAKHSGVKTAYAVAMNRTSRDILQKRRLGSRAGDDGLVFPNPHRGGGIVPYDSARDAIAKAIVRAGVKTGTPHDLRHTFARIMSRTQPPNVVQSSLGHKSSVTTRIYTNLSAEDIAKELENFGIGDGGSGLPPRKA